jgi:type VI secretion system protein ImpH
MVPESRQSSVAVAQTRLRRLMEEEPFSIHFFQMVRMLERLAPERGPVGFFASPANEVVRFSAPPSLTFPASELQTYICLPGEPDRLEVAFMGLNVVNGPMPTAATEVLLERRRAKDRAALEFLDIFNHRVVSLFYRAWKKYHFFVGYEESGGAEDAITQRLHDLVGLGTPWLRNRMAIPDETTIYFSGILSNQVRSVQGLRQILEDYFGVKVEIEQFTGCWVKLPPSQQTSLREGSSFSECLGSGIVVGDEVWDQQSTMTVRLGPMPLRRYREFLPGDKGQKQLEAWLAFYSRREFEFVVQLVLDREDVPETILRHNEPEGARLGYESWLKVKPMGRDPDETTYILR